MTKPKPNPSPASPLLQFVIESIRETTRQTNAAADAIEADLAVLRERA